MADDLDPSTSTFGTANMLLQSGDAIEGSTGYAWGAQAAKNTGWLWYLPRMVHAGANTIGALATFDTIIAHAYIAQDGTYSIYGHVDADGAPVGNGLLKWDGTTLVTFTSADATTGSLCGWVNDAGARWVAIRLTGSADSSAIYVVSSVSVRNGSYAP